MKAALQAHRDAINVIPLHRQVLTWAMRQNITAVPHAEQLARSGLGDDGPLGPGPHPQPGQPQYPAASPVFIRGSLAPK